MADETKQPSPNNNQPAEQPQQQQSPQAPPPKGSNKALKIVLIVIGVLVALGIIGTLLAGVFFANVGEEILEGTTNSEITTSDEGVSIESDAGESSFEVGSDIDLPEDLPSVTPIFEPAEITSSTSYSSGDSKIWSMSFDTDSSGNDVYEFYKNVLNANGWNQESTIETGGSKLITSSNEAERVRIQASVSEDDGETSYSLTVTASQEE